MAPYVSVPISRSVTRLLPDQFSDVIVYWIVWEWLHDQFVAWRQRALIADYAMLNQYESALTIPNSISIVSVRIPHE